MYGLILENIAEYVRKKYGAGIWREVLYVAGLEIAEFETFQTYSEGLPQQLIWAIQDVTNTPIDELMENIGESFYDFVTQFEYHKMLRVLGRRFTDFLNGLDNLHEFIRFSYPKLRPPSFYCENESSTGVTLHYRSKRRGFLNYVRGQIKNIAKVLYDTEVKVEVLDTEIDEQVNQHVILRLHFNNTDYSKNKQTDEYEELISETVSITADIFFDIFPYIIVFNRGMRIQNIGVGLARVMPHLIGKKINHEFVLAHPLVNFRWEEIMLHSNNVFVIVSVDPLYTDGVIYYQKGDYKEIENERRRMTADEREKFLNLKGAMLYMSDWEAICFMGIPVMNNLDQMLKSQMFINDFALHDSSREFVLASTQQKAEIRLLLDQEAKKKVKLEESMSRLESERERSDKLLYQLLPPSVADKLRSGASALSTCESFDVVTVLFTDIVGFTTLCSGIPPMAVVKFLNVMYSVFDELTEKHGVYKVETIGDAYMVVSGAPKRTKYHAELAADCALGIVAAVGTMVEETANKKVRIRAGLHSGPVMTGVVGLRMPRYCLFGETVGIANKMESTGQPMKIQISETTKANLESLHKELFHMVSYSVLELEPGRYVKTYFLEGKDGVPRDPHVYE